MDRTFLIDPFIKFLPKDSFSEGQKTEDQKYDPDDFSHLNPPMSCFSRIKDTLVSKLLKQIKCLKSFWINNVKTKKTELIDVNVAGAILVTKKKLKAKIRRFYIRIFHQFLRIPFQDRSAVFEDITMMDDR